MRLGVEAAREGRSERAAYTHLQLRREEALARVADGDLHVLALEARHVREELLRPRELAAHPRMHVDQQLDLGVRMRGERERVPRAADSACEA